MRDFINHLAPTGESALFRERFPKSWWWDGNTDFLSAILYTLQISNWQRGGGKGARPKQIKRPDEKLAKRRKRGIDPQSADELKSRREQMKARLRTTQREAVSSGD